MIRNIHTVTGHLFDGATLCIATLLLMSSIMTQLTALEFCRRNVIVTLTLGLNSEVLANKH